MSFEGQDLATPERLERGMVFVLPGIEGRSRWNRSIVRGLVDAGLDCGIEIFDWTQAHWHSIYNLRAKRLHVEQSDLLAGRIREYRSQHPDAPLWLIGHSGGGAMSVLTLEHFQDTAPVSGAILLGAALSPTYDLAPALRATTRGIWNFCSWGDVIFLVAGTLIFGTLDGRHTISAGARGFHRVRLPGQAIEDAERLSSGPVLTEVPWARAMLWHGNFAGHFGYTHRRFVRHWIATIVQEASRAAAERTAE